MTGTKTRPIAWPCKNVVKTGGQCRRSSITNGKNRQIPPSGHIGRRMKLINSMTTCQNNTLKLARVRPCDRIVIPCMTGMAAAEPGSAPDTLHRDQRLAVGG